MIPVDPYLRSIEPLLVVISGPSGVGKDTVVKLMAERKVPFFFVVTVADRELRAGEVHGKDYFFVRPPEFDRMIDEDLLLEWAHVYGGRKGVPREQVRRAIASGKDVIMRLDVQGAATIRRLVPDAVLVFLIASSEEEMVARLRARKTDSEEEIARRIAEAKAEVQRVGEFDYLVVNPHGRPDAAVDDILAIINAEHRRVQQRRTDLELNGQVEQPAEGGCPGS